MSNDDDWSERPTFVAPRQDGEKPGPAPAGQGQPGPDGQSAQQQPNVRPGGEQPGQPYGQQPPAQDAYAPGQSVPPNQGASGGQPYQGQPYQQPRPYQQQGGQGYPSAPPGYGQQGGMPQGGQQGTQPGQPYGQQPPPQSAYAPGRSVPPNQGAGGGQPYQGQPYQQPGPYQQQRQPGYQSAPPSYAQQNAPYQSSQPQQAQFGQQHSAGPFGAAPASGPAMGLGSKLGWGVLAGGLLSLIGLFGAWYKISLTYNGQSRSGSLNGFGMGGDSGKSTDAPWSSHGYIILIFVLIAMGVCAARALGKLPRVASWAGAGVGLLTTALCLYDWSDIHDELDKAKKSLTAFGNASFTGNVGWGVFLTLLGGLVMLVTGALSALRD